MKVRINREFLMRHLFVMVVMLAMGGWFGYDGFVNYPQQDDKFFEVRHLKRDSAIERQKQFMVLALLSGAAIGLNLLKISRFSFEFDDSGFTTGGKRYAYADIVEIKREQWDKKRIVSLVLADGKNVKLDAWHHSGVNEFYEAHIGNVKG